MTFEGMCHHFDLVPILFQACESVTTRASDQQILSCRPDRIEIPRFRPSVDAHAAQRSGTVLWFLLKILKKSIAPTYHPGAKCMMDRGTVASGFQRLPHACRQIRRQVLAREC